MEVNYWNGVSNIEITRDWRTMRDTPYCIDADVMVDDEADDVTYGAILAMHDLTMRQRRRRFWHRVGFLVLIFAGAFVATWAYSIYAAWRIAGAL